MEPEGSLPCSRQRKTVLILTQVTPFYVLPSCFFQYLFLDHFLIYDPLNHVQVNKVFDSSPCLARKQL